MSLETIKKIAEECYELGVFWVKLGGGEPLLHPNFAEIIKIFRSKGIFISLSSNGFFIDDKVAELIYKNKVKTTISIEGPSKIDESIRGKGHFEVAKNAMFILKKHGVKANFRVTLTKAVLEEGVLEELKQLAIEEETKVKFAYCKPSGEALEQNMIIDMGDKQRYYEVIKLLNKKENKKYFIIENGMTLNQDEHYKKLYFLEQGCGAGNRTMHIDAIGTLSPCVFLRNWYDSSLFYKDTSIKEFWRNEKKGANLEIMREISFPKECNNCHRNCNGQCKALRLYNSGSILGNNPNCLLNL